MKQNRVAVSSTVFSKQNEAEALAAKLHLDWLAYPHRNAADQYDYLLLFHADYLSLQKITTQKCSPFYIDFLSKQMRYRIKHAGLRKERVARAMGIRPHPELTLIDATAGLGRDSYMLAALGYHLTLLERSPILYALLQDGLARASLDPEMASICKRLHLIHADANTWLTHSPSPRPDIIYLDPMFEERKKTASVKKEMATLQDLLENNADDDLLLYRALTCATRRVVVKRSRFANWLAGRTPSFSMPGKSSRFDIYLLT